MPYSIAYDVEKDYILVIVSGEFGLDLLRNLAREVGKIITESGCTKILNDLRTAKPTPKILEIYQMPQHAKNSGVSNTCKRALVVGDRRDEFYFLETVFINQGHSVNLFENCDEALDWLFHSAK